ncbi:kinetochore protein isoform X2 [Carex rostrata]
MRRRTTFLRNEGFDQSLSDEDIEDELDEVTYDNDCTEKLRSLFPNHNKNLSSFSDCYQSVHKSGDNTNEPIQSHSQYKDDHLSDSFNESISDEDNFAVTENSLAYQCGTSTVGEKYNSSHRFEGSEASEWNQILDELDFKPKKPVTIMDKGKTKLKFSIHSNSNQERPIQELKIKKENTCTEDKKVYANEEFDILEDINEEDDIVPYKLIPYERKEGPYPSMAELLEGLQGNNGTPSFLNSNVKDRDREEKKRILPNLGERTLGNEEDPPEYIADHSCSDEEVLNQNKLSLLPQQIEGQRQTMADLFQETFNASNETWPALAATNPSGNNYHGRLLQVMQLEKERHAEFSRFFNALHISSSKIDKSTAITVQIMSRSLEGRLTVCHCLFQLPLDDNKEFEGFMDGDATKERTVIFNPKMCENVDLVVGNFIRIYPPWKEVIVKEEKIILCYYYSSDVA